MDGALVLRRVALRVETGGHGNTVVWGAEVRYADPSSKDETSSSSSSSSRRASLSVVRQDPLDEAPSQTYQGKLSQAELKRLWKDLKQASLWTLPRTDYLQTLSDDCYHLGTSVEVEHKDFGTFKHQTPTGPIVLVSSVNPTLAEQVRFLAMIRNVTEAIEQHSSILVPNYVKMRWQSRSQEIELLTRNMLAHASSKQQAENKKN